MGIPLGEVIDPYAKHCDLEYFRFKTLIVDAYNTIYQFLSSIRQRDGTPLMDSKGRVTSHLSGILYRNSNIVENDANLVYVFDGKPPELKRRTLDERVTRKSRAEAEWREALQEGDLERAKTKAAQTSRLTREMIEDSKKLLKALGIPVVQAPSEGEAQAAFMVSKGEGFACVSQDYDSLLFGASRLARNVAVTGRRKLPGRNEYAEVSPEIIELEDVLAGLRITREQLVDVGIIIGTDFDEGLSGYGPKRALTAVRCGKKLAENIEGYEEIKRIFLEPKVTEDYELEAKEPDEEAVLRMLCGEHDFSEDRVKKALEKFKTRKQQKTLDFFH
jgi:flap endonuclease-1